MSRRVARLVLLGLAAAALPAAAADAPLWELGLGVAGLRLPHYRGAQEARSWLLPVPYAVYRGEILRANRDGVKAMLLDSDRSTSTSACRPPRPRAAPTSLHAGACPT
jgi:outer membrane protein